MCYQPLGHLKLRTCHKKEKIVTEEQDSITILRKIEITHQFQPLNINKIASEQQLSSQSSFQRGLSVVQQTSRQHMKLKQKTNAQQPDTTTQVQSLNTQKHSSLISLTSPLPPDIK